MAVIELMTPEQRSAIARLIQKPTVQKIVVWVDSFNPSSGYLRFNLYGNRGPEDIFLSGLIEPDGGTHT